ncbi:MAG TPA: hypothetical protein VGA56_09940 [Opitutaceae bacterium]
MVLPPFLRIAENFLSQHGRRREEGIDNARTIQPDSMVRCSRNRRSSNCQERVPGIGFCPAWQGEGVKALRQHFRELTQVAQGMAGVALRARHGSGFALNGLP